MSAVSASMIDETQIGGLAEAAGIEGVRAILEAFWESTDELRVELEKALLCEDSSNAARIGHTLKGSAANIGAAQLAEGARVLEDAAKRDELDQVRAHLAQFDSCAQQTRSAIEDILKRYA